MVRPLHWLAFAAVLAGSAWAADKPAAPRCEPSRACAIELAREAGRQNYAARKEVHEYAMALITIGDLQLAEGNKAGLAATIEELLKVVPPGDEIGYRTNVAILQVLPANEGGNGDGSVDARCEATQRRVGALGECAGGQGQVAREPRVREA
jgi:hypothetical protein